MKIKRFILLVGFIISFFPFAFAQDELVPAHPETDEFAIELLYKHFQSHYTPKDLLHKAQRQAMYIGGEFKKGEEAGKKAIDEFNYPFTQWNQMDGFHPHTEIIHIDKAMVMAHPNPALHKICNVEDLLLKFKDHAGRLVGIEAFEKIRKQPKGIFIFQYTTWDKSITKVASPLYVLNVMVSVPGTPYLIHTMMPLRAYSIKEMDRIIENLDFMVEYWSILK